MLPIFGVRRRNDDFDEQIVWWRDGDGGMLEHDVRFGKWMKDGFEHCRSIHGEIS